MMLRRGRDFARLAPILGVNAATKKSRLLAAQSGRGFDGIRTEFEDAVRSFNKTVLHLRSLTRPRKRRREE